MFLEGSGAKSKSMRRSRTRPGHVTRASLRLENDTAALCPQRWVRAGTGGTPHTHLVNGLSINGSLILGTGRSCSVVSRQQGRSDWTALMWAPHGERSNFTQSNRLRLAQVH